MAVAVRCTQVFIEKEQGFSSEAEVCSGVRHKSTLAAHGMKILSDELGEVKFPRDSQESGPWKMIGRD